jgi:Tol biopolymer transport system component
MKIWRVAIDQTTGVASGAPELVSQDAGAQVRGHLSMGADGRLAYMDALIARSIMKVAFDPTTGATQGTATRLHESVYSPTGDFDVSPDGQWIVWRTGERQEDVYVMRSDGTELRQLTNEVYRDRGPFTWSPDGSKIVFRSDRPLNGVLQYRWYSMNPDGTGLERLPGAGGAAAPQWSPDLSKVIADVGVAGGGERLHLANTDSTGSRTVATTPGAFDAPIWAPDGRRVAYREVRGGVGQAYILDVSRPGATPEALPAMNFQVLDWSPDGQALAGNQIFGDRPPLTLVYDLRTRQFEQMNDVGAGAQWLADGRQLLFVRDGNTIQIVDRATKAIRDLVSVRPPNTLVYLLSPDGRAIYYLESELQGGVFQMRAP